MEKNIFNPDQIENVEDGGELFIQLVKKAMTEKNSDFEFIRNWEVRKVVKQYIYGVDQVIRIFSNLEKTTYKTYVNQVKTNTQDLQTILAFKQFNQCRKYYSKERDIALDMLDEYRAYIFGGHIWDTLVGNTRTDDDCVDYRDLPWRLF